jgi:uncharacterized protein YlxW (UPF0749 family)
MSLLVDLSSSALDPGYAEAAARRDAGAGASARNPLALALGAVVATLLIVIAGVQAHARAPVAGRSRTGLVAQVEQQSRAVAALTRDVARLRAQTESLRDRSLLGSAVGLELTGRLRAAELAAGTIGVQGPGLRVTLSDARGGGADRNRVEDRDVQLVVNALWAAGAEAISINGERLTAQSAIRQAGEAILVDFTPVSPPYILDAVGDPVAVETAFATSSAAARMRSYAQLYGLGFGYARHRLLRLPPAAEEPLRFARPVTPSPSPTRGSPPP